MMVMIIVVLVINASSAEKGKTVKSSQETNKYVILKMSVLIFSLEYFLFKLIIIIILYYCL